MRIAIPLFTIVIGLLSVAGCDGSALDKVNGSVVIEPGTHAGNASTVNGEIEVGHDATIGSAKTVNGGISLGPHAHAGTLKTVNGGIDLDTSAEVTEGMTAVNGSIEMASGSHVHGRIENVNGTIKLDHANVDGGIVTVGGDVTIGSGSIVRGGLHVETPHGLFVHVSRKQRIVIESGAQVDGTLQFDREVDLFVAADAKIGKVVGATAQPYTGKQ